MNVTISSVSCKGLKNTDGSRGTSDPYVVFRPMNVRPRSRFEQRPGERRLAPKRNTVEPAWPGVELVLELGAQRATNEAGFPEMSVEVWDSDSRGNVTIYTATVTTAVSTGWNSSVPQYRRSPMRAPSHVSHSPCQSQSTAQQPTPTLT